MENIIEHEGRKYRVFERLVGAVGGCAVFDRGVELIEPTEAEIKAEAKRRAAHHQMLEGATVKETSLLSPYEQELESVVDSIRKQETTLEAIGILREYASSRTVVPSDEEIERAFPVSSPIKALSVSYIEKQLARIEGARWMRKLIEERSSK